MWPLWDISCNALDGQIITESVVTGRAGHFYWVRWAGGDTNENCPPRLLPEAPLLTTSSEQSLP